MRVKPYEEILATLDTPDSIADSALTLNLSPIAAKYIVSRHAWKNSSTRRLERCNTKDAGGDPGRRLLQIAL